MSTRNPSGWTDIRDIVRRGQDTLTRIYLAGKHQERLKYAENALKQVAHCFDMAPPQTLGESCLEMAQDELYYIMPWWEPDFSDQRGDIQALRRAMYHTHRDPKMERLDKLIDKVRDAWSPPIAGKTGETQ